MDQRTRTPGRSTPVAALALLTLLLHLWTSGGYGYFRDEFYYIACGERLAWGYVDHPPLIAAVAWLTRALFGDAPVALRLFPALAHAGIVALAGAIAAALGGGLRARTLAALAVAVVPVFLGSAAILNMNPFEQLLWAAATLLFLRAVRGGAAWAWAAFGAVAGVGLLNKHSYAFFLVTLALGLVLAPERRVLRTRGPWLAAAIAAVLVAPHLAWQVANGWPTLEFLRNAAEHKIYAAAPHEFLVAQVLLMHPINLPLVLLGWIHLLRARDVPGARAVGVGSALVAVLLVAIKAKHYYLAPALTPLLAAGAVAAVRLAERLRASRVVPAYAASLLVTGALFVPLTLPILPPETFVRYARTLGFREPPSERHRPARLPQTFADMFGWEEMVAEVARVYHGLSPEERVRCAIFASNYGEAGAIDFLGRKYRLPRAVSGHNSYWTWGPPDSAQDVVIAVGESPDDVAKAFEQVEVAARFSHPWNMPYESDLYILIGRRPRMSWREIWRVAKDYI